MAGSARLRGRLAVSLRAGIFTDIHGAFVLAMHHARSRKILTLDMRPGSHSRTFREDPAAGKRDRGGQS